MLDLDILRRVIQVYFLMLFGGLCNSWTVVHEDLAYYMGAMQPDLHVVRVVQG